MKVILTDDVVRIGRNGDLVNVKDGFFRNYLRPNNLAVKATKENLKEWEAHREEREARDAENKAKAEELKAKLEEEEVVLALKAGEDGKLFGSVTNKDIAEKLEEKGYDIDRKKIEVNQTIKEVGEYGILVRLYPEVSATLKVKVEAEEE